MDLAIVNGLISLIEHLVRTKKALKADLWTCQSLKLILEKGIQEGDRTLLSVEFMELLGLSSRSEMSAKEFWARLTEEGICQPKGFEEPWQVYLSEGTLATRMMKRLGTQASKKELGIVYKELSDCLMSGSAFIA
jgi:carboxylate-amine ligase